MDLTDLKAITARAVEQYDELSTFVDLYLVGLRRAARATEVIDLRRELAAALRAADPFFPEESVLHEHQAHTKVIEKFAKREATKDFPYLFGLATVRLWSIAELMVGAVVITPECTNQRQADQANPDRHGVVPLITGKRRRMPAQDGTRRTEGTEPAGAVPWGNTVLAFRFRWR